MKSFLSEKGRAGLLKFSAIHYLVALLLLFLITPLIEHLKYGDILEALSLTLVLCTGVLAVGGRGFIFKLAICLVLPTLAGRWINYFRPDLVSAEYYLVGGIAFVGFVVFHLLRFVLRAPRVNEEVLAAGVAVFLTFGLLWTIIYIALGRLRPDSFAFSTGPEAKHVMNGPTALYFSFITLTTVGYGDIAPVSNVARTFAFMEAITGNLYLAVLVARLVSLYSSANSDISRIDQGES